MSRALAVCTVTWFQSKQNGGTNGGVLASSSLFLRVCLSATVKWCRGLPSHRRKDSQGHFLWASNRRSRWTLWTLPSFGSLLEVPIVIFWDGPSFVTCMQNFVCYGHQTMRWPNSIMLYDSIHEWVLSLYSPTDFPFTPNYLVDEIVALFRTYWFIT